MVGAPKSVTEQGSDPGLGSASWRRADLAFLALCSVLTSLAYAVRIWSFDFWWHAASGRWIATHGRIPSVDPFTYTALGRPWNYVNWLGDLLLYGTFDLLGAPGIVLLKVVLAAATLFVLGLTLRELRVRPGVALSALIVAGLLVQPRFSMARTFVLGVPLLVTGSYLCVRWWCRGGRALPWWLVPITAVWMPIHGNSLIALLQGGVLLIAGIPGRRPKRDLAHAALALVACTALFAVTDTGRDILAAALQTEAVLASDHTAEMGPASFSIAADWIPWLILVTGTLFGALHWRRNPVTLGLALVGLLLASRLHRHIFEAILLGLPAFALAADAVQRWLHRRAWNLAGRAFPAALALALLGLHFTFDPVTALRMSWGLEVDQTLFSDDAVLRLQALPPGRAIHDMEIGGFLMWHRIPEGVFVDGRTIALFDNADFQALVIDPARDSVSLELTADSWNVTYGICSHPAPLCAVMMSSMNWIPVYHGGSMSLFVRRNRVALLDPASVRLKDELRALDDDRWMSGWYAMVLSAPGGRERLRRAILDAMAENPASPVLSKALRFLQRSHPDFVEEIRSVPDVAPGAGNE